MGRCFFVLSLLLCCSNLSQAQSDTLRIEDNTATIEQLTTYILTHDSLVILARSDYGRARYDYLHRALTKKEQKRFDQFIKTYPFDSLKEVYFTDYSNFPVIDADHFPRVIDIHFYRSGRTIHSKATNAWVKAFADIIDWINPLLPAETRLQYDKSKFNAFY